MCVKLLGVDLYAKSVHIVTVPTRDQLTYIPTIGIVIIFVGLMKIVFSCFGVARYVIYRNGIYQPFDNLVYSFPVNLMLLKQ